MWIRDFIAAALDYHRSPTRGKISVVPTKGAHQPARSRARPIRPAAAACDAIVADPRGLQAHQPRQPVAVVTNGTAVLGLGNIGPLASSRSWKARAACSRSSPTSTSSTSNWPRTTRTNHRHHRRARAHAGRHQPRGHQGTGVLHIEKPPARAHGHPGLPRRPARHRHHLSRRPGQWPQGGQQEHRRRQAGVLRRRRRGGACLDMMVSVGLRRENIYACRPKGRHLRGPHPTWSRPRRATPKTEGRTLGDVITAPTSSSACRQGRAETGDGGEDGRQIR